MKPAIMVVASWCMFMLAEVCVAHPPDEVSLEFNAETAMLKVEVRHSVNKVAQHFIDKVVIVLNGEEIIEQKFTVQGSKEIQEACYTIPGIKNGDELKVTAYCNISGKKTGTLEVQDSRHGEE